MAELKRAGNKMEDQGIPRAALSEGVLTIDVDSHVETMEEQEDARWHQLLNAHRTKKILTVICQGNFRNEQEQIKNAAYLGSIGFLYRELFGLA